MLAGSTLVTGYRPLPITDATAHIVTAWGPDAAATSFDLGASLLPTYTTPPTVDAASHAVTWTPSATGVTPDLAFSQFEAIRTAVDISQTTWRWAIAAPYTSGTLTLPVLPGDAATYNPVATDEVRVYDLTTGKLPGGYDAARAGALNRVPSWMVVPPAAPATGMIVRALFEPSELPL